MSFRRFVFWCALCGGWAALAAWALGRQVAGPDPLGGAGVKGLCLGLVIALALGVVDALWIYSLRQVRRVLPRVLTCVAVGGVGGLLGGFLGQLLYERRNLAVFLVLGWALTGLLVGVSVGTFDYLRTWVLDEDLRDAGRKVVRGVLGGLVGGLLGGFLYEQLRGAWGGVFPGKADLWSPSATGFVALGLCIGLSIAVAQVVLKEAWLYVEAGFRKGREIPLGKPEHTVGRAESCDVGLFGDAAIDRLHARILRRGGGFVLADAGSATGTFINGVRVVEPVPLRSGDVIGVGKARLRFRERPKRAK